MKRSSNIFSDTHSARRKLHAMESITTEKPFIFRPPFSPTQKSRAVNQCLVGIEQDFQYIQSHGYPEFVKHRTRARNAQDGQVDNDATKTKENLGSSFEGTPRDYQIFMLERAKEENAIVHLGTGMGKTLISIMLIKEFLSRKEKLDAGYSTHILFIVPSIALAVQHTDTLRANLACAVETACHTSSHSSRAREDIAKADVIVATHGAVLDLLRHYPDVLSMSNVKLLVMDECHYATGNHNYATMMDKFYHALPREKRPRVLGLTASPLINVAIHTDEDKLQSMLSNFESIMDARLFGFPTNEVTKGNTNARHVSRSSINIKEAEETVVEYDSSLQETITTLPGGKDWNLHKSRVKEMNQLQQLCDEVGPRVTAVYALALAKEISRNEFDRESQAQFQRLTKYLESVVTQLNDMIENSKRWNHDGHTNKMRELEKLLHNELKSGTASPVGIVFVERRITALALCTYFCEQRGTEDETSCLKSADDVIAKATTSFSCSDSEHGIYDDAENDHSMNFSDSSLNNSRNGTVCGDDGRFDDAEDDNTLALMLNETSIATTEQESSHNSIRCDCVVRNATQIFKYLGQHHKLGQQHKMQIEDDWVHQTKRIRAVISKLRRRETNVLFATSVVEEGVDVEACSFVISFDCLKTIKSYIQMKGRARQRNAKFFVFADASPNNSKTLSLKDAQTMEQEIHQFIVKGERKNKLDRISSVIFRSKSPFASDEEAALHEEEYLTSKSIVDLSSSKSLLNRFAMSVPLDPSCRTSKDATTLHMPIYTEDKLILPSHIPFDKREVRLPVLFQSQTKRMKHALLALAACVRLHKLGLLNDRLLPLSDQDMKEWLLKKALVKLPSFNHVTGPKFQAARALYVYGINQSGDIFRRNEAAVLGEGRYLALFSFAVLPTNIPSVSFCHNELGCIHCSFDHCQNMVLSDSDWKELVQFHSILFNARWRRRRKNSKLLCFDEQHFFDKKFPAYVVGCLQSDCSIDWKCIRDTITDFSRSLEKREAAVQAVSDNAIEIVPRVWAPTYSPNVSYVVFGPSKKKCSDSFPGQDFDSYEDYFAKKYNLALNPSGAMFSARRMFQFPQSFEPKQNTSIRSNVKENPLLELPQELCAEAHVANPAIILHSVMLPQILYHLERYLTAASFKKHCTHNFPSLGKCLSEIPINSVVEILTAKSCSIAETYDKLEWLGDGVLKLIQTDALLKLRWTSYLHEGYLSMLRSAMGSNDRLRDAAKAAGIDAFILITPLSRSDWTPCGLRCCDAHGIGSNQPAIVSNVDTPEQPKPSDKVCADVVEAILGLVYIKSGLEVAMEVACELGVSFAHGDAEVRRKWSNVYVDKSLTSFANDFLGITFNNTQLVAESTTHQSCLHKPLPSYQRLEWVGDAVLCLAAREWLFCREENLSVAKLVVLETTLVCNEALAYIGFAKGLHRFIDHRDARLPGRFNSFQWDLETTERGLWSTDPPKVIPDVVEALIGAAHVDLGFHQGKQAALHVIRPITESLPSSAFDSINSCLHPKQLLFEMTGGIVHVRAYKEDAFHRLGISCPLWNGNVKCTDSENTRYVGLVSCKEIIIVAVAESSSRAASNVACALAVDIFKSNPSILSRLKDIMLT